MSKKSSPDPITVPEPIAAIVATGRSSSPAPLAPPAPPSGGGHKTASVGDPVLFRGQEATVIRVRKQEGLLDLVQYTGGSPAAFDRVVHDRLTGWCWPHEVPARPPTLEEQIDAAAAEGRLVPRPGLFVEFLHDAEQGNTFLDIRSRRARVLRATGLASADLELFQNELPPEEPDDPDPVVEVRRNVPHAPDPKAWVRPDQFCFAEDGFTPTGRVRWTDARPRFRCLRCSAGADTVGFDLVIPTRERKATPTIIRVCGPCHEAALAWAEVFARPVTV